MSTPAKFIIDGVSLFVSADGYELGATEMLYNMLEETYSVNVNNKAFKGYVSIEKLCSPTAFIVANKSYIRFGQNLGYNFKYIIDTNDFSIKAYRESGSDLCLFFDGRLQDYMMKYSKMHDEDKTSIFEKEDGLFFVDKTLHSQKGEVFSKNSYLKLLKAHLDSVSYFSIDNPNNALHSECATIMKQASNLLEQH